ncbi:MAG: hypothetical protein IPL53_21085 [Ignavibacteria bacterium]|nr:hypothetical protein [Ignavibacteria bacterium]
MNLYFELFCSIPKFKENIVPNLVYVDWTDQKKGHPRILDISDFSRLKNSTMLFARKFDLTIDSEIFRSLEGRFQ